ncbi:hydroxymethylpyrimidine/phosphomethylpyrimidine kinase [Flavivirga eckloniae]|uniref:hydroxymethylpyrimidine kinase n=1 Tax=Flavivirga eckloniae TaxID=1803846 RepID=A0A2K9PKI6_9FLAO|nr:hydroxymethylpyrimidine/phosphomethylpyrimidine kinase [Flavivirga eckloniae]AUP77545.1 hydroxymethylpyrimidine/phosphomethylpyrimidine kinase [Flavivirga eckloniae]
MNKQTYILSIAGFDPSNGAGIASDVKTFEAHGLYGLSVCTALTVQNDMTFQSCKWVDIDLILDQIHILFDRFMIDVVKIGIVENWQVLSQILDELLRLNPNIKMVLDPVLKSSTGFDFHEKSSQQKFESILNKCYIITPNFEEIQALYPDKTVEETIKIISDKTNLYLKGGHRTDNKGRDELYRKDYNKVLFEPKLTDIYPKHGSGCVLASAIASNLTLHADLIDACRHAKWYTEQFLNSTKTLLGTHSKTNSHAS